MFMVLTAVLMTMVTARVHREPERRETEKRKRKKGKRNKGKRKEGKHARARKKGKRKKGKSFTLNIQSYRSMPRTRYEQQS